MGGECGIYQPVVLGCTRGNTDGGLVNDSPYQLHQAEINEHDRNAKEKLLNDKHCEDHVNIAQKHRYSDQGDRGQYPEYDCAKSLIRTIEVVLVNVFFKPISVGQRRVAVLHKYLRENLFANLSAKTFLSSDR